MPTLEIFNYAFNENSLRRGTQTLRDSYDIIPGEAVDVGNERQLLMDWHVVDDLNGARRTVHQPVKHPDNPILRADDGRHLTRGTVLREKETGLFRMWLNSFDPARMQELGKHEPGTSIGVYYESDDGVSWRAPDLGLFDHFGGTDNNVFSEHTADSILLLPPRMRHKGRYARLYAPTIRLQEVPENRHHMTQRIAYSDDGIIWKDAPENPVICGRCDTLLNMHYNPDRDVFMQYRRTTVNAGEVRRIAYTESTDLVSWTQPVFAVRSDELELDPHALYAMGVSRYNGMYLGMLWCYWYDVRDQFLANGKDYKMDVQLAWSRDGITWDRHPQHPTFIPVSLPVGDAPDWGMVQAFHNMIEVGDQVYIYYNGKPRLHGPANASSPDMPATICLATLERDRFVSVGAGDDGGYMLTRPLACPGGRLHINARATRPDGFVKVAVREGRGVRDGEWPEGWRFEDATPFTGDSLDHVMRWGERDVLNSFPDTTLRLHFWTENAELYSFWFE